MNNFADGVMLESFQGDTPMVAGAQVSHFLLYLYHHLMIPYCLSVFDLYFSDKQPKQPVDNAKA